MDNESQEDVPVVRRREHGMMEKLQDVLDAMQNEKPNDRSEIDRRYAIVITDFEKVIAYYAEWIVRRGSG